MRLVPVLAAAVSLFTVFTNPVKAETVVTGEWCNESVKTYTLNTDASSYNYSIKKSATFPKHTLLYDVVRSHSQTSAVSFKSTPLHSVVNSSLLTPERIQTISNCVR